MPGKVRTADAKNTFLSVTLRKYRTFSFRHISVIEHHSSKSRPLGEDALEAEMMIALNGPSIVHCSGIVKESMSTYWKQFQNANLQGGHFCRRGTGAIKLYKVSKAVDALNSKPVKCKFML